jgi:hypothetical protein
MVQQPCDKQPCRARNYQRKFRALPGRDARQAERVHKLRILQQDVCKQDGRSAATDKVYERTLGDVRKTMCQVNAGSDLLSLL